MALSLPWPGYEGQRAHIEIYEFWPSDLQRVFEQAGIPRRRPPTNAACNGSVGVDGAPPRITSPLRGSTYTLRLKQLADERIPFSAISDVDVRVLYWFVDDAYIGRGPPNEWLYWQPRSAGQYTVRVVDDHGRTDKRLVDVSLVE